MANNTNPIGSINLGLSSIREKEILQIQMVHLILDGKVEMLNTFFKNHPDLRCDEEVPYNKGYSFPLTISLCFNPRPNAQIARLLIDRGANPLIMGQISRRNPSSLYWLFATAEWNNGFQEFSTQHACEVLSVFQEKGVVVGEENQQEIIDLVIPFADQGGLDRIRPLIEHMETQRMIGGRNLLRPALEKAAARLETQAQNFAETALVWEESKFHGGHGE